MDINNYKDCVDEEEEVAVCDRVDEKEERVSSLGDKEKGKPRIVSIEKVNVAPRSSKPGPKFFKKKTKTGTDQVWIRWTSLERKVRKATGWRMKGDN